MRLIRYTYPTNRRFLTATPFLATPWTGLENEVDRLLGSVFRGNRGGSYNGAFPVDLFEDKENTYVRAELPGFSREAIQVEVVDGQLSIQASSKTGEGDDAQTTSFSRSVGLSDDVHTDRITAQYENGVLTVTLPKKEESQPKKVTVPVS